MKRRKFTLTQDQFAGIQFVIEQMVREKPNIPISIWFPLKQNISALKTALEAYKEGTLKILNQYVQVDEAGNFKMAEGRYVFIDGDGEGKMREELKVLADIKETVPLIPLTLEMVAWFGDRFFSDWNTLEPILDVQVEEEVVPA